MAWCSRSFATPQELTAYGRREMHTRDIQSTLYEVLCPFCRRWRCSIRLSRIGSPYFTCPHCGIRVFVNGPEGKRKLFEMAEERGAHD